MLQISTNHPASKGIVYPRAMNLPYRTDCTGRGSGSTEALTTPGTPLALSPPSAVIPVVNSRQPARFARERITTRAHSPGHVGRPGTYARILINRRRYRASASRTRDPGSHPVTSRVCHMTCTAVRGERELMRGETRLRRSGRKEK